MKTDEVTAQIHGFSEPDAMPTPWPTGLAQVKTADTFWISTVRPDGRPHVTPLIAVWHDEALWFTTGPEERKARNLAANPAVVLTTGRSDLDGQGLDIVLEGRAEQVDEPARLKPVLDAFTSKYGTDIWHFEVRDGALRQAGSGGVVLAFRVRPLRGLGFGKGEHFTQTTWIFPS